MDSFDGYECNRCFTTFHKSTVIGFEATKSPSGMMPFGQTGRDFLLLVVSVFS